MKAVKNVRRRTAGVCWGNQFSSTYSAIPTFPCAGFRPRKIVKPTEVQWSWR